MQDALIFAAIGILMICVGMSGLLGYRRHAYIFPFSYGYVTGGVNYGSIPLGIMSLIWALAFFHWPESLIQTLLVISLGFGLAGVLFGIMQPSFLDPQWYRWLKENHTDIMLLLRREIMDMGYKEWKRRTRTQQGLEEWVVEVRHKHGFEPITRRSD